MILFSIAGISAYPTLRKSACAARANDIGTL